MALDELIADATELRAETGGEAPVLILTPRGYMGCSLLRAWGFENSDGAGPTHSSHRARVGQELDGPRPDDCSCAPDCSADHKVGLTEDFTALPRLPRRGAISIWTQLLRGLQPGGWGYPGRNADFFTERVSERADITHLCGWPRMTWNGFIFFRQLLRQTAACAARATSSSAPCPCCCAAVRRPRSKAWES
jgi:hypothetical protein